MQYHLNGYRTGDPSVAAASDLTAEQRSEVDVLIVGCGPAGLTLAAQLAAFPDINTRIVDKKSGPLLVGQADGVACRSMEMFEAFGFADAVKKEAYWVNEVAFWRPAEDAQQSLVRVDRIQDVEDDLSEMPHTILNQARVHDFYLQCMLNSARRLVPDYGLSLEDVTRDNKRAYPIKASFTCTDGRTETINAKYLVGCDGARSKVRSTLGYALEGDAARQLWGVMDVLAITDFPDIRLKVAIQSADSGSMLIIPREGGYMVRLYIEIDELQDDERASDRKLSVENLIDKAQAILSPYKLDVKEVVWWSAYEIGQRVCESFDDTNCGSANQEARVFIAGDACHTHSPKAGQGMNVSMADTFNLGWKLASVLQGYANDALLRTYSEERQAKARELIDFDRDMAKLFSTKPKNAAEAEKFQEYFKKHSRYTAGVETCYEPSLITAVSEHQALASGFPVGKRFHSAPVVRLADAKPMELGHTLKADGRWRLLCFANAAHTDGSDNVVSQLCHFLKSAPSSPVVRYTPQGADIDFVIDFRLVLQQYHRDVSLTHLPEFVKPAKGSYGLTDYEKVFCVNPTPVLDIFNKRGVNRETGAMVIVRPDQYVAHVLPLEAHAQLSDFFSRFFIAAAN